MVISTVKKVWIEPGCITCGACEFIVPEIFEVTDVARVRPNALCSKFSALIEEAAAACPVSVIAYEKNEN